MEDKNIEEVVLEIGLSLGRSQDELKPIIEKLKSQWITKISHWHNLSKEKKQLLDLPVMLIEELDKSLSKKRKRDSSSSTTSTTSTSSKKRQQIPKIPEFEIDYSNEEELFSKLLDSQYQTSDSITSFLTSWKDTKRVPYPHSFFPSFLSSKEFANLLKKEILSQEFYQKKNDLYDFHQTDDFSTSKLPNSTLFRKFLYSAPFRRWLESITGIKGLTDKVDMSAAKYTDGSILLCHDDQVEGRKIAYIYYLVDEDWNVDTDGGGLGLFGVDKEGNPDLLEDVVEPQFNSFVFFEVTKKSWHEVCEVTTALKDRISISGWFHAPSAILEEKEKLDDEKKNENSKNFWNDLIENFDNLDLNLNEFIDEQYLKENVKKQIKKQFFKEGSVELHNFLKLDKYSLLVDILHDQNWEITGPSNKRRYEIIKNNKINISESKIVENIFNLLKSKIFSNYLKDLTDLDILKEKSIIRRFQKGAYTLVHDEDMNDYVLDVVFCCATTNEIDEKFGGYLVYMSEDDELLMSEAKANSILIVLRDKVMRFVKYMNHNCKDFRYDFSTSYTLKEQSDNEGDDDDKNSDNDNDDSDGDGDGDADDDKDSENGENGEQD